MIGVTMDITIDRNGTKYGPYTVEEVKEHLANGNLNENDWAWHEGSTDWIPLKDIMHSSSTDLATLVQSQPETKILSISRNGVEIGQWTEDQVRSLYKEGHLVPTDFYWTDGITQWKKLGTLIKPPVLASGITVSSGVATPQLITKRIRFPLLLVVGVFSFISIIAICFKFWSKRHLSAIPNNSSQVSSTDPSLAILFAGKWHAIIQTDDGILVVNLNTDGKTIHTETWLTTDKTSETSDSKLDIKPYESDSQVKLGGFDLMKNGFSHRWGIIVNHGMLLLILADQSLAHAYVLEKELIPFGTNETNLSLSQRASFQNPSDTTVSQSAAQTESTTTTNSATRLTSADVIGTYRGTNVAGEQVRIQLNGDNTCVISNTSRADLNPMEGIWKIEHHPATDNIAFTTPDGTEIPELLDPISGHPGTFTDVSGSTFTKDSFPVNTTSSQKTITPAVSSETIPSESNTVNSANTTPLEGHWVANVFDDHRGVWISSSYVYIHNNIIKYTSFGKGFGDDDTVHEDYHFTGTFSYEPNPDKDFPPKCKVTVTETDSPYKNVFCKYEARSSDSPKSLDITFSGCEFTYVRTTKDFKPASSSREMSALMNHDPISTAGDKSSPTEASVCGLYSGTNGGGFDATIELGRNGKFLLKDQSIPHGGSFGDWALHDNTIDCYVDGQKTFSITVGDDGKLNIAGSVWEKIR